MNRSPLTALVQTTCLSHRSYLPENTEHRRCQNFRFQVSNDVANVSSYVWRRSHIVHHIRWGGQASNHHFVMLARCNEKRDRDGENNWRLFKYLGSSGIVLRCLRSLEVLKNMKSETPTYLYCR
ncbi:hypothetical protein ONS95_005557 [Cadophora gregata]|uniref:uncharacterized protein n=1 Tax=Cadophora gregata TaxID=51156 RepID=UPI0026DBD515|nr:uncharacterized protein ONS95_005557 [Cadophora gregata]KAK0103538.1 hypothetical protein ONS95_005557 [Cadophora gregata]KAK0107729.1 hypothetical protein ONS96_003528 [Cadophora gregata f. sp. sojae]